MKNSILLLSFAVMLVGISWFASDLRTGDVGKPDSEIVLDTATTKLDTITGQF